jgi:hypothetical protein
MSVHIMNCLSRFGIGSVIIFTPGLNEASHIEMFACQRARKLSNLLFEAEACLNNI